MDQTSATPLPDGWAVIRDRILNTLQDACRSERTIPDMADAITRVIYTEALLRKADDAVDQLAADLADVDAATALQQLGAGDTDPVTIAAWQAYKLGGLGYLLAKERVEQEQTRIAAWLYLSGTLDPGRHPADGGKALLWAAKQIIDGELAENDWTEHVGDFVGALEQQVPSDGAGAGGRG